MAGFDLSDRDQRQADAAHLLEQAVQRGLVDDRPWMRVAPSPWW
jgi:hypothetical protein